MVNTNLSLGSDKAKIPQGKHPIATNKKEGVCVVIPIENFKSIISKMHEISSVINDVRFKKPKLTQDNCVMWSHFDEGLVKIEKLIYRLRTALWDYRMQYI